jgi:hypothetical protein
MPRFIAFLFLLVTPMTLRAQVRLPMRVNVGGANQDGANRVDGIGVAARGSRFCVAWAEQGGTHDSTQDIHVAVSEDDGLSWSAPRRVDLGDGPHATDADQPKVLILEDGTLLVAFEDSRASAAQGGTNEDLLLNRSSDGGQSWLAQPITLNGPTGGGERR